MADEQQQYSDGQKLKAAFNDISQKEIAKIDKHMCWICDWHEEPMPLANKYGTEMNGLMKSLAYPPEEPYQDDPKFQLAPAENVLVFADSYGFASGILKYAPEGRIGRKQVVTTPPAQLNMKPQKVEDMLKEQWDLIIYAYTINEAPSNDAEDIHNTQTECCKLLLQIGKAIVEDRSITKKLAIITCDAYAEETEIHEEMGVRLVTNSWAWGFTNTARLEMDIPTQYIDTEWSLPETSMPLLASEIWRQSTFGKNSVRILKTGRYVLRKHFSTQYEQANNTLQLSDNTVIGISGGNGAVALVIGSWMIDKALAAGYTNIKFAFLSRSMKITDQNMPLWKGIEKKIEGSGVQAEQMKGDVGTKEGIEQWVKSNTPNIGGFVHSAGVLADTLMGGITWKEFETVWQPKSRAALYLHKAFETFDNPKLGFFWMFSSVATFGNMGQLNYSASNAFMDGLARHRRAMGLPALTLQWGAWGEVGMAANLDENSKRRMANSPMPPFMNAEGIAGTECLVRAGVAWGSVYKMNGTFMVGMVSQEQGHANQNGRALYSGVALPPPSTNLDPENIYHIYKSAKGIEGHKFKIDDGLVYQYYVAPKVDDKDY